MGVANETAECWTLVELNIKIYKQRIESMRDKDKVICYILKFEIETDKKHTKIHILIQSYLKSLFNLFSPLTFSHKNSFSNFVIFVKYEAEVYTIQTNIYHSEQVSYSYSYIHLLKRTNHIRKRERFSSRPLLVFVVENIIR